MFNFIQHLIKILFSSKKEIDNPVKDKLTSARGKGLFVYDLKSLYSEHGGLVNTVNWFKSLNLDNIWIRIIGKQGWSRTQTKQEAKELIRACLSENIKVGSWGFIYDPDDNPGKYAQYVIDFISELELDLFVHNMEFDHEDDSKEKEIEHANIYWHKIKNNMPENICHGLSSFWHVDYHPLAWNVHMDHCDFIAPQVYQVKKDPLYTLNKAIKINNRFKKPQVLTLQAFWGEMLITENRATQDLITICRNWSSLPIIENNIIGLNLWHAGGKSQNAFNKTMQRYYSQSSFTLKK
ncbi:MAG: hypothetical protein ACOCV1_05070 [Bacillota bacterium]